MTPFRFPGEPAWDEARDAIAFPIQLGEYEATVFIPRREFRSLLGRLPTPEEAVGLVASDPTRFERAAEHRVLARLLDEDANITLTGRELRATEG
ncbi:MAG: DUF1488 family protein [Alphaproteobacteria bacterium]|nr:DUF1488 family protein [Alphaproteobacteria bacterium]TAD91538.1 MAG: DUF1488 family protein [Alphaproteobacteria bacterium]